MAKIGEGDPRWIVQDRKDGNNVNAWHWEERDLTKTCHEEIKARLKGLPLLNDGGDLSVSIKEVSDLDGDITIAQRKGKIMCYFELKATIKWTGSLAGDSGSKIDGKLAIPEIEHDNFAGEFAINVSATESNAACQRAEQWMRTTGRGVVRAWFKQYFEQLFETYRVGMNVKTGLPATPVAPGTAGGSSNSGKVSGGGAATASTSSTAAASSSSSGEATSFSWKIEWRCPMEDLWGVLTDERRASAYTRSPAKIDPQPSGAFEFLGGAIAGYFVQVEHPSKLMLQWRLQNWASGVFSSVVILLSKEEAGVTRMEFAQSGVPAGEVERVKQGWCVNFWDPIKIMFGFSYNFL